MAVISLLGVGISYLYGATTPALEKWFKKYNEDKPYCDRVRPFNFLLAMQATPQLKSLKPVASYDKNPAKALARCFDRASGERVRKSQLKTYLDALAQYHLHPEAKFLNANYLDKGITQRRHIIVKAIHHIGKEVNKWEEQFFTGFNPDAQIEYGISPEQRNKILKSVLQAIETYGANSVASAANLSERHVLKIYKEQTTPSELALAKLDAAVKIIEEVSTHEQAQREGIKRMMEEKRISIRNLAIKIGIDASNLSKIISGRRNSSKQLRYIYVYLFDE